MSEDWPAILIVDDDEDNRFALRRRLRRSGYKNITTAENGREALERVAEQPFDLILLDIMMPEIDGFEVCRTLKGNDETRLIPIVIMTALDAVDDRIKGIEAGADDFLTKPLNERELIARIQTTLALKQTVDRKMAELRRVSDHFSKFVPEDVKRMVEVNPEAPELARRERNVSVLFLDISGYTALCETLPMDLVNGLVEQYFSGYLDRIVEGGGDLTQTAGDDLMAIFEDDDPENHAARAAGTALGLLEVTEQLNRDNAKNPLRVHMGFASGAALVGSTRFEGARGSRWTFTAHGPIVNLAARLAGLAQAGQILVGPYTVRLLGERYELSSLGAHRLKNIAQAVDVHELLAAADRAS